MRDEMHAMKRSGDGMSMALVVHYRRTGNDYAGWCVETSDCGFAAVVSESRTSFGAVFRLAAPLPDALQLRPRRGATADVMRRVEMHLLPLHFGERHVFLQQHDRCAHPSPPRLMSVSVSDARALLELRAAHVRRHLLPATVHFRPQREGALFLLDLSVLPHSVSIAVRFASNQPVLRRLLRPPFPLHVDLRLPHSSLSPPFDLPHALALQARQTPRFSARLPLHTSDPRPIPLSPPPNPLLVSYYRLDRSSPPVRLHVAASNTPLTALPHPNLYHTARLFSVDISPIPSTHPHPAIVITPTRTTADSASIREPSLTWKPQLGRRVIYAQSFPHLLTPAQTDLTIVYHRYNIETFLDWHLHVWSNPTNSQPAVATKLFASPPINHNAQLVFHLLGFVFPYRAKVFAEPVCIAPSVPDEPNPHPCRRDVVRTWTSADSPPHLIHLVQGDCNVYPDPPSSHHFLSRRYFRLRYRRFLPNDYNQWDLWTWDPADPVSHRLALSPVAQTPHCADFIVDRAQYGAANTLCILPRKGADAWLEKDDFVRCWHVSLFDSIPSEQHHQNDPNYIPTFIIVQASALVITDIHQLRSMARAYVHDQTSIVVTTPIPVPWISPPMRGRPQSIANTTLRLADKPFCQMPEPDAEQKHIPARSLFFHRVKKISPTRGLLIFDKSVAHFDEDFLVENVVVSVPSFDSVRLSWETHEDVDRYLYTGRLGWEYSPAKCLFRCFAPTADQLSVVLYDEPSGGSGRAAIPMRRIPQGCWKAICCGDLKGKYYKLLAEGENKRLFPGVEVIDPYSPCNTAHAGRGLIYGKETTPIFPRPKVPPIEAIVYELHVRDITIDKCSGVKNRGKFTGLAERGTTITPETENVERKPLNHWEQGKMPGVDKAHASLEKVSTGLDHIAQMGVNAVQIMPVQDFDNDESNEKAYRWGYMPVHFNSPDGWYASTTHTVARVSEFKQLVDAIHRAGLKVIMDVVYNHTAEDSNECNVDARFSFNGLVPRYYYRTCGNTPFAHNGESTCGMRESHQPRCGECYSNGSGCGNEFRSESPMGRKFIIDSLKFWVTEYQVDGFRFDLLGLIDIDTVQKASAELRSIDPNVMIYGEPWIGGLSPIRITDKGSQRSKGFGVFNDSFRNAIRGSPFDTGETFIMDGGRTTEVKAGIIGSIDIFTDSPIETINYVECHDNRTLWDHMGFYIRSRTDDIEYTEEDRRRMHRLAAVLIFTSQGIPFIQAGQEMCRTKFDDENSYESSDEINMIRWHAKLEEWPTVQYYRGLILLRRSHPEIFCLETAEEIRDKITFYEDCGIHVPERCIAYRIAGDPTKLLERLKREHGDAQEDALREEVLRWSEVVVIFNATPLHITFELPGRNTNTMWLQILDAYSSGVQTVGGPFIGHVGVGGRSSAVLRKASAQDEVDLQLDVRLSAVSDAYCSFHGDDPLSRYAVGLESQPTAKDKRRKQELVSQRLEFQRRTSTEISQIAEDIATGSQVEAVNSLNKRYGKI